MDICHKVQMNSNTIIQCPMSFNAMNAIDIIHEKVKSNFETTLR
jgi:hypothetical protein